MRLRNPRAPQLPIAPAQYTAEERERYSNVLRLYFNQLDNFNQQLTTNTGGGLLTFPFGAFQDNTTQTIATTNTAQAVTFDTTDGSNQITRGSPTSRIEIGVSAWYNIQFSAQIDKSAGSAANIWIWPRVNGQNIPDSASKVAIQGTTAESVPAWNWVLPLNGGDYFELFWLTDDVHVQLKHEAGFGVAPNDVPEIPSVILTVTFVSALLT